jgi:hypothetical protein
MASFCVHGNEPSDFIKKVIYSLISWVTNGFSKNVLSQVGRPVTRNKRGLAKIYSLYLYLHLQVKKVKSLCLTKHHAMKTYCGSGGIALHILDFGTRWRWVVSFTPRPLNRQGRSPRYPLDWKLGGPESRSGRGGEDRNFQSPPGIEP